jgi:serine/threonine-protein kinase
MTEPRDILPTGTVLDGTYRLTRLLGQGAMGTVYKARQTTLDRWVAVKLLKRELAQDQRFLEQFQKEARTAGKLRHENIVSALDCGHANGEDYFIMEYVEGRPLSRILQEQGKLPEAEALAVALQVARGLDYAWQHRIIHRDIKSENILISPQKGAKICDLGLCRDIGTATAGKEGYACTPSYASPEQARRDIELDCRTDIYSLGIVLYQMATGTLPFQGKPLELLAKHMTEAPPSPLSRNPSISPGLNRLILDMIEKDKAKRPQTPKDVVQKIEALQINKATMLPDDFNKQIEDLILQLALKGQQIEEQKKK